MSNILSMFGVRKTDGDIGIEIEAEASKGRFPRDRDSGVPASWKATIDGSLRGESVEYVLTKPCKYEDVPKQLDLLYTAIKASGAQIKYSFRAGVHVHINVQDLTLPEIIRMAAIYYTVENLLVDWCGSDRVGNHHCLRVCDAEYVIDHIANVFAKKDYGNLGSENIRYSALNFTSIPKYGSLEFRSMATEENFNRIPIWVDFLWNIKNFSKTYTESHKILFDFSILGVESWLQLVLGDGYKYVALNPNKERYAHEGMRYAQDLIYFSGVE